VVFWAKARRFKGVVNGDLVVVDHHCDVLRGNAEATWMCGGSSDGKPSNHCT
jgi:hypothetical protein